MSGGSYNYAYCRVEDFAASLRHTSSHIPARMAFATLLDKVAAAMHDIEWVDSGDYSVGKDLPAIRACVGRSDELQELLKQASEIRNQLDAYLMGEE